MEKHSGEIKNILGKPPHWLLQYGAYSALAALLGLLALMYFISYPDKVEGRLRMTTIVPPISVVAPTSGYVELLEFEGTKVDRGQEIGIIQNSANRIDVVRLEQRVFELMEFQKEAYLTYKPEESLELGAEIQEAYDNFNEKINDFVLVENDKTDENRISQIKEQKRNIRRSIAYISDEIKELEGELKILLDSDEKERSKLRLDGDPVAKNKIYSAYKARIKQVQREIIQKKANRENMRGEINNSSFSIFAEKLQVEQGSLSKLQEIKETLNDLYNTIQKWKNKYYIKAPSEGTITLYDAQIKQQLVEKGQEVVAVVPPHTADDIIGRVSLPLIGSGQVDIGQRVLIKFDTYPFLEYGLVEGKVKTKGVLPTPTEEKINLQIELPNGLLTSRGDTIAFRQNMLADVEIITEDARLYQRVFGAVFDTWNRLF